MTRHTTGGICGVANVVVPIRDHEEAIRFYCGRLGFELRLDQALGPDFRWVEVAPAGAVTTVALARPRGGMWRSTGGDTNISLLATDVDAEYARLRGLGVDVDDGILRLGPVVPPMFRFRDPDGNEMQVVQGPAPV